MIITCAPFRISFVGGGTDLPFFYRKYRGAVLSATINRYVYISIHPYFNSSQTVLKYSKNEMVNEVGEIAHPIFREALGEILPEGGVEIVSTADIPSGTGLGSSSTFTVALLLALHSYKRRFRSKEELAREACDLEINRLKEPIGKQDQYAAAYGGMNFFEFNADESVVTTPLLLPAEVIRRLEDNLIIFYTGDQRQAKAILKRQIDTVSADEAKFENMQKMVDLAYAARESLIQGDLDGFAGLLHQGWVFKRGLCSGISNGGIDAYYERALAYGAQGGKLLGAGGGGFLLLYCAKEKQDQLRKALFDLHEMPFSFSWTGSSIVHVGEQYVRNGFIKTA